MTLRTEEDARNSQCCRDLEESCDASACMAWRWQPLMADEDYLLALAKVGAEFKAAKKADGLPPGYFAAHLNKNRAKYGLKEKPDTGYCGLAGIPQTATTLK